MATSNKYICLDIGGTKVLGALVNSNGEVLCKFKKKTKAAKGFNKVEESIVKVVEGVLELGNCSISEIKAIAAGAPGVINSEDGIIQFAPNLPWRDYDIRSKMQAKFNVPFFIENDGNAGVLGELTYGIARGKKNIISLCIGTGVGGGIVIDGALYTGKKHAAAEFGHTCINPDGPICTCGQRGCLEAYSGKVAITHEIVTQIKSGRKSILSEYLDDDTKLISSKLIKMAIENGDELTIDVVKRATFYLSASIGAFINIFNPELVVLGGGIMEACSDFILPKVKNYISKFVWNEAYRDCEIVSSRLADDAIIFGALTLIKNHLKEEF